MLLKKFYPHSGILEKSTKHSENCNRCYKMFIDFCFYPSMFFSHTLFVLEEGQFHFEIMICILGI